MVTRKKKAKTGFLHNNTNIKAPKHHGTQRHCVIWKKSEITEQKYRSHSAEDCFGKRTNQKSIRDWLVGPMGSRAEDVKQYTNSNKKKEERAEGSQEEEKNALYHCQEDRLTPRNQKNQG